MVHVIHVDINTAIGCIEMYMVSQDRVERQVMGQGWIYCHRDKVDIASCDRVEQSHATGLDIVTGQG
jgi:hypothetical protein